MIENINNLRINMTRDVITNIEKVTKLLEDITQSLSYLCMCFRINADTIVLFSNIVVILWL